MSKRGLLGPTEARGADASNVADMEAAYLHLLERCDGPSQVTKGTVIDITINAIADTVA
jgi:hypothetical protein